MTKARAYSITLYTSFRSKRYSLRYPYVNYSTSFIVYNGCKRDAPQDFYKSCTCGSYRFVITFARAFVNSLKGQIA